MKLWGLFLGVGILWPTASVARPDLVAHRGASHDAPENTLAAFRLAWEQGADAVEGDFHLTQDGQIVCLHDHTTERTSGRNLEVSKTSLAELQQLDVGSWKGAEWAGERIPTLGEVLATIPHDKKIFIEIKCGPEIVEPLKKTLAASSLRPEQTVVISFSAEVIAAVKKRLPQLKAYWLTAYRKQEPSGTWIPDLASVLRTLHETGADGLDSQAHEVLDRAFINRLRQDGLEFHTWTVDDPILARRMMQFGADSITTNRPRWLREQLERDETALGM